MNIEKHELDKGSRLLRSSAAVGEANFAQGTKKIGVFDLKTVHFSVCGMVATCVSLVDNTEHDYSWK